MKPRDIPILILKLILAVVGLGGLAVLMVVFSPIFIMIVVVVFFLTYRKHLIARQYAFLWAVALAAERSIPLESVIRTFAGPNDLVLGRRVNRLATMIDAGVPLPEAFARSPGLVPREVMPVVRIGCETGTLGPALRRFMSKRDLNAPIWHTLACKIVYLCCLVPFFMPVVTFMMIRIAPEFSKIFQEFDCDLPPLTQAVFNAADLCADFGMPFVSLVMLFVCVAVFFVLLRYSGWIQWNPPGVGRLLRRLDTAAILDALSLATDAGRPLGRAVATLASCYPQNSIRCRLFRASREIENGSDWCESLRREGLIKQADLAVLQAAARVGNLTWALREMADSNRRRLAYRLQTLVQLLFPPVILLFGAVVALFVVGFFVPLILLIQNLV